MKWALDIGIASIAKLGEELCGDAVEILKNDNSTIVVVSDGLGSGVKANILATLTSKIAANLLSKGVVMKDVVDTITATLPICQIRQIAYSTFTIVQIFDDGQAYLAQFDNPNALFIRNNEVTKVLGTVKEVSERTIKEKSLVFEEGDILIVVSDGVTHAGIGALKPLGLGEEGLIELIKTRINLTGTSQDIAEQVKEYCEIYSAMEPGDDITVVVLKLRKPVRGVILSGPPLSKGEDVRIVEEFFTGNRRRAICGGTTANIVAREKNLKLHIIPDYCDTSLPPTASMPGIDLVTEGILTLTRAVELLEGGKLQLKDIKNKEDGASQLLKWLLQCDEIDLMVGLRVNPAHLTPDLPFHLGQRSSLLQHLRELLVARGKKVTIKWF